MRSYVSSTISKSIRLFLVIRNQCHVLLDVERLLFPVTFRYLHSYPLLIIFVLHHFYTICMAINESCVFQKI